MLALYRKYRPAVFEDVIAQDHITRTLTNQIKTGRVTHAYLFTGSRGTGKTTCARIFARAINCLSPVNGSPCGKCEVCKALSTSNIDIVELDAASNNGVDQIRDIVETVQYPPVNGKYKVYIVDEVHMLTPQAFNALLKTLEEPPSHSVFVLATTEVHKLPATVLSRCMRFDFRLVDRETLTGYLKTVYEKEGVKATDEALELIASAGEGSVRDMLSIADRCMNYSFDLTYDDVLSVIGSSGKEGSRELFSAIASEDIARTLSVVDRLCAEGKSVGLIAKDLCAYARDLLLLKTSDGAKVLGSKEDIAFMKEEASVYSVELLVSVISLFSAVDAELRYSVSPRIVLEVTALKACKLVSADLTAIEERLARIERRLEGGVVVANSGVATQSSTAPSTAVKTSKPMDARSVYGRLMTHFRINESPRALNLLGSVKEVEVSGDKIILWADGSDFLQLSDDAMISALRSALTADGAPYEPVVNKLAGGVDMDNEISKIKKLIGEAKLNIKK